MTEHWLGGYIGILHKKMEATAVYQGIDWDSVGVTYGYYSIIPIMQNPIENEIEATIIRVQKWGPHSLPHF